jgi:hypothetical protein
VATGDVVVVVGVVPETEAPEVVVVVGDVPETEAPEVVVVVDVPEAEAPEVVVVDPVAAGATVVVVEDACAAVCPATPTPMPTAATVAVTPMATVARRMRTSASSRERDAPALRGRWRGVGTMTAPFVDGTGRGSTGAG